MICRR